MRGAVRSEADTGLARWACRMKQKKKAKKIRGRKELAIYQSILYIYIYRFVRLAIIKIIKYIFHNMANDTIHSKLVNHGVAACLTC